MRFWALPFVFILMSASALAAGANTITVIGDDGKVTTIEIPVPAPPPQEPPPMPPGATPAPMPEPVAAPAAEQIEETQPTPGKKPPVKEAAAPPKIPPAPPALPSKRGGKPSVTERQEALYSSPEYAPPSAPAQGTLSKEQAIAIAMQTAPPVKAVTAVQRNYNGALVYAVTFRPEEGEPYDVLIDAFSGARIK
jgi:hypothetical protein